MQKFLTKLFIKDYTNYDKPEVRTSYGKMCSIVGIISNALLCIAKMITGFLIGSIAIVADGINNMADAGSSIITLIGFKLASAPADSDHPYGHQRIEYIAGLIVSFIILIIGVLLAKSSVEKIISGESNEWSNNIKYIMIGVLAIAIIVKLWQSIFNRSIGKKINSLALIATSVDSLNDCISTAVVLLSTVVTIIFPHLYLDGYIGIIVSVFILISGIKLVKETISPLIGEAPSPELIKFINDNITKHDGVLGLHDLVIHSYGPGKVFITAHVEVDEEENINVSHDMIDNIEKEFSEQHNLNLVIHMDPVATKCVRTLELKQLITNTLVEVDPILKFHDFRVVLGTTHTNVIFDLVMPVGYYLQPSQLKQVLINKVKEIDSTLDLKITIDQEFTGRTK